MKGNKLVSVSVLTITGLFGMLTAFLILVFWLLDVPVLYALIGSIIALILQFLVGPFLTDLNMRWIYKAKFDAELPVYLSDFIADVCEANNMKLPRIGYIDDGAPNAFTYGHTKNDARIILTRGIFEMLNEEEVKAVVGHELGHAAHNDILVMTAAQLVPMVLYAVYKFCSDYKSSSNDKDDSKSTGAIKLIGVIAYLLYIIANYIVLWLSRTREYMADAFSAEVTRNPNALGSALVEIGFGLSTKAARDQEGQSVTSPTTLGISDAPSSKAIAVSSYTDGQFNKQAIKNAMKWDLWNPWATIYELNSTHPLISKRLMAISELSPAYGQEPYILFDLVKPESYMDDFAKDVLISFLPAASFIIGLIIFFLCMNPGSDWRWCGLVLVIPLAASLYKYGYSHPKKEFAPSDVRGLLGEVKVSGITSIPCEVKGTIIGRGNPGCVFNEDFVVRDESGIMLLDYSQPLFLINKVFALFKSPAYFDKIVTARGYYRRAPVPYIQLKELVIDGEVKKCYSIIFGWIWRWALLGIAVLFTLFMLVAGAAGI